MRVYTNATGGNAPNLGLLFIEGRYIVKTTKVANGVVTLLYDVEDDIPIAGNWTGEVGHGSFSHMGIADPEARRKLWEMNSAFGHVYKEAHEVEVNDAWLKAGIENARKHTVSV